MDERTLGEPLGWRDYAGLVVILIIIIAFAWLFSREAPAPDYLEGLADGQATCHERLTYCAERVRACEVGVGTRSAI